MERQVTAILYVGRLCLRTKRRILTREIGHRGEKAVISSLYYVTQMRGFGISKPPFLYCGYRTIVRFDIHKRSQKSSRGEVYGKAGLSIDKMRVIKFDDKARLSKASQTINDIKSTIVMEFTTVQKVVQIVDVDSNINLTTSFQVNCDRKRYDEQEA
ncbi:hypothetical protein PUN28_001739 [Cardiocondyla obscurior]|uniref:Uncharacterized protein n=1 Tax=Cardiocondyla obscurior TaxID=286306 RepID=A0AAW2GR09_9HYME